MIILLSGYGAAYLAGISVWGTPTTMVAQILFVASGVVWQFVLRPAQARQLAIAEALAPGQGLPPEYRALAVRWFRFGLFALALAIGALVVSVVRI
jgi:uncharacterized membrane protein